MSEHRHIYGEIHNKTGMKRVFGEIWRDVDGAKSRPALTELYKRLSDHPYPRTILGAKIWQ